MKYTLVRIGIVIIVLYTIGFIFALFTEFGMKKKLLDMNSTHTIMNITMPHGNYFDIRLETDIKNVLNGNITIKEKNKIIYRGKIEERYTPFESSISYYNLIPNDKQYLLEYKEYILEIEITNISNPISLNLIWLDNGLYTLLHDNIKFTIIKGASKKSRI